MVVNFVKGILAKSKTFRQGSKNQEKIQSNQGEYPDRFVSQVINSQDRYVSPVNQRKDQEFLRKVKNSPTFQYGSHDRTIKYGLSPADRNRGHYPVTNYVSPPRIKPS